MKKLSFPSAYTVLILCIFLAVLATWMLPSGNYHKLTYDAEEKVFVIESPQGREKKEPSQQLLDDMGIKITLDKFEKGNIRKPIAIPGTYKETGSNGQGFFDFIFAPIRGIYEAIDVILFVLIIGGFIGIFNSSGAFNVGMQALARRFRGRESWLIVIVFTLMALGGTSFGLAEETLAFYPILVPVFLAAGYDVIVPLAVIYIGSNMGFMASTTNPFSVIIASDAVGISWTNGIGSRLAMLVLGSILCITYIIRYARKVKGADSNSLVFGKVKVDELSYPTVHDDGPEKMDTKTLILLILFGLVFIVMVIGVWQLEWWFLEMTALFLVAAVVFGILQGMSEKNLVKTFIEGSKELLGVAFIIGIARGVGLILDAGLISDTILFRSSAAVSGMSSVFFIIVMMLLFGGLSLFIPSSSGMAVLTMPIFGGLAEVAGVPREEIINAYIFGMGIMGLLTPAGLILPSLGMVNVSYDIWLKFIMPLVGWLLLLTSVILSVGVLLA